MSAFQGAISRGYSIETDVWADSQGQLWVFHDRDVFRSTGVHGNIDEMTTQQVAALRYTKAGSSLPTFQQAMGLWAQNPSTRVYIEPKQSDIVPQVAQAIRANNRLATTYITAFTQYSHNVAPDVKLVLKNYTSTLPDPQTLPGQGVNVIALLPAQITTANVEAFHQVGVEVEDRDSNDTSEWRNTISAGADGQLTDVPDQLLTFCPHALSPPVVDGFSPTGGLPGTVVTITGADLTDATQVFVGDSRAPFSQVSSTRITATVPTYAATGPIIVITPTGSSQSAASFQVPPTITTVSPTAASPGSSVTIVGSGYRDATAVSFGGVAATFAIDSRTQITATVPQDAPAQSRISVTTPAGQAISDDTFEVLAGVGGFSPTSATTGTAVVISGSGFSGASSLTFGNAVAEFRVDSSTQITAVVPQQTPFYAPIHVVTAAGDSVSAMAFRVLPAITGLSSPVGAPGESRTVTGSGFDGATGFNFGTVPASSFTVDSPTQITAVIPPNAPAKSKLQVVTPHGRVQSPGFFSVPPAISGFTPTTAAPGASVVLTGSAFTGATAVRFGTIAAASFTVDSPTQITAVIPTNAPAKSKLQVITAGGSVQSAGFFSVPPAISGFTPTTAAPGASVVLTGSAFTGATAVRFGTIAATSFTVDSPTQITAVIPTNAPAKSKLQVVTAGGSVQSAGFFSVPPAISGFTPTTAAPGASVVLTGSAFTGATAVRFGTIAATSFTVDSPTQITAVIPTNAPAKSKLQVVTAGGSVQSAGFFTVLA